MKIAVIPIDNRPVCYNLVNLIADIDDEIELFMPERKLLGGLTTSADIGEICEWLKFLPKVDAIVVSLDTIAYGGLVASRRSPDSFEQVKSRLEEFKNILKEKEAKIYAFSSIMRISNNNVNEEEKPYWDKFGKKIFDYSYHSHKFNGESCIKSLIPDEILDDYIATRKRNFEINKLYLNWLDEGVLDTLVYSKDDCAEFGFNVQEALALEKLSKNAIVKTGADEIPLTLFARAYAHREKQSHEATNLFCHCEEQSDEAIFQDKKNRLLHPKGFAMTEKIKIAPVFLAPAYKHLISKYEDISIEKSVIAQIELSGSALASPAEADLTLLVNNFEEHQGEIVMEVDTKPFDGDLKLPQTPYMIADVRFANGADNAFMEQLKSLDDNFYGYSAWNTSANSLGSLICAGVVKFCAKKYNDEAFKKLQAVRFLDDWAYQANVRQEIKKNPDGNLAQFMLEYENRINEVLATDFDFKYGLPWGRSFEVEVEII